MKQQWLIKLKRRNIHSIQHARICHAYCSDLNPGWKKIRFQLALSKTFWPTPRGLTHQRLKHPKEQKQCFLPPPHRFSTQSLQRQN